MAAIAYCFYEPILSVSLMMDLDIDDNQVAAVFTMITICYGLGCVVMGKVATLTDKRIVIFFCFLLNSVAVYFSGGWFA